MVITLSDLGMTFPGKSFPGLLAVLNVFQLLIICLTVKRTFKWHLQVNGLYQLILWISPLMSFFLGIVLI